MTRADWDADRAEKAADISLGSAQVAVEVATKVMDAMPTPDVRDDPNFQRLAGLEQSMLARLSPRHKNRWPELGAIDGRLDDLDRLQQELHDTLSDLRARRAEADADYASRMYESMQAGKSDPKPTPETPSLDDAISEPPPNRARWTCCDRKSLPKRSCLSNDAARPWCAMPNALSKGRSSDTWTPSMRSNRHAPKWSG